MKVYSRDLNHNRHSRRDCIQAGRKGAVFTVVVLALSFFLFNPANAEISDTAHVVRFEASPSFINLNFTTSIVVGIGTMHGSGQDNYTVTVVAPSSSTTSAWYNFSTPGEISRDYGNVARDFGVAVNQVGTYNLRLDFYDGIGFIPAAYSQLLVTDQLLVTTESASASNEYTDVHNCPIAQEFQRGGEIIARAYVRYASTLALVNGTKTPSAIGKINGTLLGQTKTLTWQNTYGFWRNAFFPTWNYSIGVIVFSVQANDGMGNHGVATSPSAGLTAWKIVPAILKVTPRILNQTGTDAVVFHPEDTVRIEATVTYESHNSHNKAFPGPLNATRGGHVVATLGYGSYDSTAGRFAQNLGVITLTYDQASAKWTGSYAVSQFDPIRQDLRAVITANDGASPPNTGTGSTLTFAFQQLAEAPPSPQTVSQAGGLDPLLVTGLAGITLVAGVGVGWAVARRGRQPLVSKTNMTTRDESGVEMEGRP